MNVFFGVSWRALLLQASWSFDRMQTLGFAYAIEPVLRKFYPDRKEYQARLKDHLEYFNTQPYFATFILGAVMRKEEDRARGEDGAREVVRLKNCAHGPVGSIGGQFLLGSAQAICRHHCRSSIDNGIMVGADTLSRAF